LSLCIQTRRVQRGIDDAKKVILVEKSGLVGDAGLGVMRLADVGVVGAQAGVGERAVLAQRLLLDGAVVSKSIVRRIVVVRVAADEGTGVEHGAVVQHPGDSGREVQRTDLRALVGLANGLAGDGVDDTGVQRVIGIGRLEPGTRVLRVRVDGGRLRELRIDAGEDVLFVAAIVEDGKLRRVKEAAGAQTVDRDEVAPARTAVCE